MVSHVQRNLSRSSRPIFSDAALLVDVLHNVHIAEGVEIYTYVDCFNSFELLYKKREMLFETSNRSDLLF